MATGSVDVKIPIFGSQNVGKTSLILRFIKHTFSYDLKQTIGTNFLIKDIQIEDDNVRLMIWDMAGQATYRELRRQYMKGASAAIIVYDVTRPETYMAMSNWYESFREVCPNADAIICANKTDLTDKRMVPVEPGIMLRDWFQAAYYETSAKTGDRVSDVFTRVAETLLKKSIGGSKGPTM